MKRDIFIKIPTEKISKQRQVNALMPNIIHSMDAGNIVNLIKKIKKYDLNLLTIHDCFGTHASDVPVVQHEVKVGFVELYCKRDFITRFHETSLRSITEREDCYIMGNVVYKNGCEIDQKVPSMPDMGELDIQGVVNARYMLT